VGMLARFANVGYNFSGAWSKNSRQFSYLLGELYDIFSVNLINYHPSEAYLKIFELPVLWV
jgi:hypothetical protein